MVTLFCGKPDHVALRADPRRQLARTLPGADRRLARGTRAYQLAAAASAGNCVHGDAVGSTHAP